MDDNKKPKVGFFRSYGLFWQKYFKFSGHSQRSEYWWPFLINTVINAIISVIALIFLVKKLTYTSEGSIITFIILGILVLFNLVILIPRLSITYRRYHDVGISGWWLLVTYGVPFIYYAFGIISGKEIAILDGILLVIAVVNVVLCVLPTKINNNPYRK